MLDVSDAIGTWMCVESLDTSYGYTFSGLLVGAQISIKSDGTYTSKSPNFGTTGTYVVKGNNITARNSNGDTFIIKIIVLANRMTWEGTSSTGVNFKYIFNRL
jgi:hypothetical protein